MCLCVYRFPEYTRCHASLSTTPSDLQYYAACFPGAPGSHDVHPACRSVTYTHQFCGQLQQFSCIASTCVCVDVCVPLLAPIAGTQTMGPQAATAAAAAATNVRGVPQYKYAAGVRNPQQHMTAQPQVTMQQVGMHVYLLGHTH